MKPKGFDYNGETIFYMEPRGKDISFERWRITLYYEPGFARTHFEETQADYLAFLKSNICFCYTDYDDFKKHWKG